MGCWSPCRLCGACLQSPTDKHGCAAAPAGWLPGVRQVLSPNCDARPDGVTVDLLVIHNISLPPGEFHADGAVAGGHIDALFCNALDCTAHPFFAGLAGLRVSSHFLVSRAGRVTQYVSLHERAWHAGASSWQGRERCNDFSIGIELEGADDVSYTEVQYQVLAGLVKTVQQQCPAITADRMVGHADIAPGRKTDPGVAFDWLKFKALL